MNLTPFLLFDGQCAEAMAFYQACFGGELAITKVRDTPMREWIAPVHYDKVINSRLTCGPIEFSATDWLHPSRTPHPGNTVCMYLNGATRGELQELFVKLSMGADPTLLDELRDMPFGSYGHLADRFGVHWFFQGE